MYLKALHLKNFRSYDEALFEFDPKINVIHGPNAKGKTTLLEAISFLMTGRSFRTAQHSDLIKHGTSYFCIEALIVKNGIEQKLRVYFSQKERKITVNNTSYPSTLALLGVLNGVIIHPDDAAVVKGAPSERRRLLDLHLAQSSPAYVHHLTRYDRAMRQRNVLLKSKCTQAMDPWEFEMAQAASYIVPARAKTVIKLQEEGRRIYNHISGGHDDLSLEYKAHGAGEHVNSSSAHLQSIFIDQLKRHRIREFDMGSTISGPHKDDISITLGKKEARIYSSEGQQRSCIVSLRLAEWNLLKLESNEAPIMLVDDFGMSLDANRLHKLVKYFTSLEQVFVTTTDSKSIVEVEHSIVLS